MKGNRMIRGLMFSLLIVMQVNCAASAASENNWAPLTGDALHQALVSRTIKFESLILDFKPSGRLLIGSKQGDVWGHWYVGQNKVCMDWSEPNTDGCFDLKLHKNGLDLLFVNNDKNKKVSITSAYIDLR